MSDGGSSIPGDAWPVCQANSYSGFSRSTNVKKFCPLLILFVLGSLILCGDGVRTMATEKSGTEKTASVEKQSTASIDAKVDALLKQMTLDEKIGQMTQVDSEALNSHKGRCREILPRLGAQRRRFRSAKERQHRSSLGELLRRLSERGPENPAENSDDLRHRRDARSQQHRRRRHLSAQHRHGCDAESELVERECPRHGRRNGGHRHQLGVLRPALPWPAIHAGAARTKVSANRRSWR